jgi:hypothetical protein
VSRGTQVPVQRGSESFAYGAFTLCGHPFQDVRLLCCLVTLRPCGQTGPTTPPCKHDGLGYVRVRSPLLAESLLISVPVGTEMVHFPTLPSWTYGFSPGYPGMTPGGFPHSEISGSTLVCSSPKLIAAYHVLHRLLAPRHSPHALSSLTIKTPDFRLRRPRRHAAEIWLTHTAVWSVKTTVCRIFSCQRSAVAAWQLRRDPPPRRAGSVGSTAFPRL